MPTVFHRPCTSASAYRLRTPLPVPSVVLRDVLEQRLILRIRPSDSKLSGGCTRKRRSTVVSISEEFLPTISHRHCSSARTHRHRTVIPLSPPELRDMFQ